MSDKVIYCRRMINDTTAPQGEYPCGLKIETANPLDWCDECRKRLPLWPGDKEPLTEQQIDSIIDQKDFELRADD